MQPDLIPTAQSGRQPLAHLLCSVYQLCIAPVVVMDIQEQLQHSNTTANKVIRPPAALP
jgi:hypothetical protein